MTISGQYAYFAPEIAECLDEAFENAGLAPSTIGTEHISSALRSIKFMLNSEWHTLGMRQWMIESYNQAMTAVNSTTPTFDLPIGGIDIFDAVLLRASRASPMYRMSRAEYLEIPDKTITGRPNRYFVDRRYNTATVYVWQLPNQSSDVMVIEYFKQMSAPGGLSNTLQLPPHAMDAFIHGLAARLALKYNVQKYPMLQNLYCGPDVTRPAGKLKMALDEDRDRADTKITISLRR